MIHFIAMSHIVRMLLSQLLHQLTVRLSFCRPGGSYRHHHCGTESPSQLHWYSLQCCGALPAVQRLRPGRSDIFNWFGQPIPVYRKRPSNAFGARAERLGTPGSRREAYDQRKTSSHVIIPSESSVSKRGLRQPSTKILCHHLSRRSQLGVQSSPVACGSLDQFLRAKSCASAALMAKLTPC